MLTFALYSSDDNFRRKLTPKESHVELLWNAPSFARLLFDDDDPALDEVVPGTRLRVFFTPKGMPRFEVMRGSWDQDGAEDSPGGERTVIFEDDFGWIMSNLGWQSPASAISTTQTVTQPQEFRRYTGPTETVVRSVIGDMSNRLGLGLVAGTSTGGGSTQRVEFRMDTLADKLLTLLERDRLTLSFQGSMVDVRLRPLFPRVLTPKTGVLEKYSWRRSAPTATRAVAGDGEDGPARGFQRGVDASAEAEFSIVREVFVNSRLAKDVTDLSPDIADALAEGRGRVSFRAVLNETSWFRFGTYRVGDRVRLRVPGLEVVDVIRQVVIEDSAKDGLIVMPVIGEFENSSTSNLAKKVAALARSVRDQGRQ